MLPDFLTHPPGVVRLLNDGGVARLTDALAAGQTYADVARHYGMTRGALRTWVASLPTDAQAAIHAADTQGASAMVEEAKQIADATATDIRGMTKPMFVEGTYVTDLVDANAILAAEKERIRVRQWMAERKDKDAWGGKAQTEVTVNLATVHLDVLRRRNTGQPSPFAAAEIPAALVPDVTDFL
jgi:hypothetical protein